MTRASADDHLVRERKSLGLVTLFPFATFFPRKHTLFLLSLVDRHQLTKREIHSLGNQRPVLKRAFMSQVSEVIANSILFLEIYGHYLRVVEVQFVNMRIKLSAICPLPAERKLRLLKLVLQATSSYWLACLS